MLKSDRVTDEVTSPFLVIFEYFGRPNFSNSEKELKNLRHAFQNLDLGKLSISELTYIQYLCKQVVAASKATDLVVKHLNGKKLRKKKVIKMYRKHHAA
jgi:hypothetical protein